MDEVAGTPAGPTASSSTSATRRPSGSSCIMGSGAQTARETVDHLVAAGSGSASSGSGSTAPSRPPSCRGAAAEPCAPSPSSTAPRSRAPRASRSSSTSSRRSPRRVDRGERWPPCRGWSAAATGCPRRSSRPAWSPACSPSSRARRRAAGSPSASSTTSAAPSIDCDADLDIEDGRHRAGGVLRPRLRRHGRGEQEHHQDPRRRRADVHAQAYFVYDSKKSGAVTVSHLRFGPHPDPRAVPRPRRRLRRLPPARPPREARRPGRRRPGRHPAAQRPVRRRRRCGTPCPARSRSRSSPRSCGCSPSTPTAVAREAGLPGRTNTVLQTCFFAISGVLPREEAIERVKAAIQQDLRPTRRGGGAPQRGRGRRGARSAPRGRGARAATADRAPLPPRCPPTHPSSCAASRRR